MNTTHPFSRGPLRTWLLVLALVLSAGGLFAQEEGQQVKIAMPTDALVTRVDAKIDQWVYAGNILAVLKD